MGKTKHSFQCLIITAVLLIILPSFVLADTGNVTIAWDPIQDPNVGGYTVVWGLSSGQYTNSRDLNIVVQVTLQLEAGNTYYFAVRGSDKQGDPGELSQEVSTFLKKGPGNNPLLISNVTISDVTTSAAVINVNTNKQAYVQVEYGKNVSLGSITDFTNVASTVQSVSLTNLSSATTYYCRVTAKDTSDNQATSGTLSFRTKDGSNDQNQDPNAPIKFIQITLSNVGNTSVTINWNTDVATTGSIDVGKGSNFQFSVAESLKATSHATALNGLTPSTVYHYQISATDGSGKQVASKLLTLKTFDRISQPAQPSADAIFVPLVVENTKSRTNLGVNNLSAQTANVSITLVDKQGMVLASKTIQVDPLGLNQINRVARFLYDDHMDNEIQGNLYIESDQPVCAWVSQLDNTTNDPSLLSSKHTGTVKILIPSSANTFAFTSSLVVMNVGVTAAQVSLKAYGTDGSVLGQTATPLSIPPNGLLTFENVLQTLGVMNNYGPIEITSLNDVPLIASSRVSSTNRSGGFFAGLKYSDASMTQIIPNVIDNSELRTNIGINNVTDNPATVMVRLISKIGVELGSTLVTVPGKGLTQLNHVIRQVLQTQAVSNVEGYIRLESNQPIFGWASIIDNVTNDPGFALSKGEGASKVLVDSTANVGNFKSSLVIVNLGNASALVDIVAHDVTGKVNGALQSIIIPSKGYFSSANILQSLGVSNNYGPVEITSTNGQPIVATSRVYSTSRTSGFFEGESIE